MDRKSSGFNWDDRKIKASIKKKKYKANLRFLMFFIWWPTSDLLL